nr:MAG TPA: hypothetical protein [Caudoviricetes sp.]
MRQILKVCCNVFYIAMSPLNIFLGNILSGVFFLTKMLILLLLAIM